MSIEVPIGDPGPLLALVEDRADEPGLAAAVIRDGDVVARRCVGLASLPSRIPIGPDTRFHIVSVSKTFMAAAILMLAARGALRLDDDVRRHLPELPAEISRNGPVTIRHLLSMTSGLRDVLELERLRGVWRSSPSDRDALLGLAGRQTAVSAPPGVQYMYANVNALLLDEVIARVGGTPAESFRRGALYEPLGLTRTGARPHDGIAWPDLALPYVADGAGGWSRARDLLGIAADPLTTTLDDVTRWLLALRSGSIGGVEVTARMAERTRVRDGTPLHYGLGLAVRRYRGLTVLCHTGSQPGYKAHIAYVPERDLGVVILSNREDTRPAALAAAIMDEAIGERFPRPHPGRDADPRLAKNGPTATQLAAVPGVYVDSETDEWVTLRFEGGVLVGDTLGDPFFLYPEGDGVFRDGEDYQATVPVELRMEFGPSDRDVTGRVNLGGQRITLRKSSPPAYAPAALGGFEGLYESAEIASRHSIRVESGRLWIAYGPGWSHGRVFPMEPIAPDVFLVRPAAPGIAYRHVFHFRRDQAGVVASATVTMERLKGVSLRRYQPA